MKENIKILVTYNYDELKGEPYFDTFYLVDIDRNSILVSEPYDANKHEKFITDILKKYGYSSLEEAIKDGAYSIVAPDSEELKKYSYPIEPEPPKIKEKLIITTTKNADGKIIFDKIYKVDTINNKVISEEKFDVKKHRSLVNDYLVEHGVANIDEARKEGILLICTNKNPELEKYGIDVTPDPVEVTEPLYLTGDVKDYRKQKRIAALGGAGVGVLGILAGVAAQKEVTPTDTNNEIDDIWDADIQKLIDSLNEEGKAFFNDVYGTLKDMNDKASKDNNFKLNADGDTQLQFTAEELIAAKITLNNYSGEQLLKIFGTTSKIGNLSLDTASIEKEMNNLYLKLSTYYMNAVEPIGITTLIDSDSDHAFFEKHEQVILDFNANPSIEASDKVIKALYDSYTYGGKNGEYNSHNGYVSWLATSMHYANVLRTRNVPEYNEVHNVSDSERQEHKEGYIEVGTKRATLIENNETLDDAMMDTTLLKELNDKSLCASARNSFESTFRDYELKRSATSAIYNTDTERYEKELANLENLNVLENNLAELLNREVGVLEHSDIIQLINHRFLPNQQLDKNDEVIVGKDEEGNTVVDKEQFDKLPSEEQDKVIKEHGTVTGTNTSTTEQQVNKEDLTASEKEEANRQEAILEETDDMFAALQLQAILDANDYVEEKGAYHYNKTIINSYDGQVIDTSNKSLFNIVAYAGAFGDGAPEINGNDNQVQERLNKEANEAKQALESLSNEGKAYLKDKYGSNWQNVVLQNNYKDTFVAELNQELDNARTEGARIVKEAAKQAYDAIQSEWTEEDNKEENKQDENQPGTGEGNKGEDNQDDDYDPNLDPDYQVPGELPFDPLDPFVDGYSNVEPGIGKNGEPDIGENVSWEDMLQQVNNDALGNDAPVPVYSKR